MTITVNYTCDKCHAEKEVEDGLEQDAMWELLTFKAIPNDMHYCLCFTCAKEVREFIKDPGDISETNIPF